MASSSRSQSRHAIHDPMDMKTGEVPKTPIPPSVRMSMKVEGSPRKLRHRTYKGDKKHVHAIRNKKAANENLTREAISIDDIKNLSSLFTDENGLKEEDFIKEIRKFIPKLTEHQVTELFLKVDANADGRVDWEELTSYMFVHSADTEVTTVDNDMAMRRWRYRKGPDLHTVNNPPKEKYHRQPITKVLYVPSGRGQFLTSSTDGTVQIWDHHTFQHRGVLIKSKYPINDMCLMPFSNKLIVANMDHVISFHDITSGGEYYRISGERLQQCNPLTLDCWHDSLMEREVLTIGDDTGGLQVYEFKDRMWHIKSYKVGTMTSLEALENISYRYINGLHKDWITKVKYIPDIGAIITSSLDGDCKVVDLATLDRQFEEYEHTVSENRRKKERNKAAELKAKMEGGEQYKKFLVEKSKQSTKPKSNPPRGKIVKDATGERFVHKAVRHEFDNHKSGVYSFDWSSEHRVIASCGVERDVLLWNPYSKRTIGVLPCGLGSVTDIVIDDRRQWVICVDVTNTIRVFDLRSHKLVQTFQQDTSPVISEDDATDGSAVVGDIATAFETNLRVGRLFFSHKNNLENTLVCSTTQLYKWPCIHIETGDEDSNAIVGLNEKKAIASVIYNSSFHQIVSAEADVAKKPMVWSVESGELVSPFAESHNGSMITAMEFDKGGRRLVTGSHHGDNLLVWNFGNSRLLKQLLKKPQQNAILDEEAEINSTVYKNQLQDTSRFMPGASYISLDENEDEQDLEERSKTCVHGSWKLSTRQGMLRSIHGETGHESFSFRKTFDRDASELMCKETTKIVYVETNTGGSHVQRFICCAGWDKKIYVWDDDEDQNDDMPIRTHRSHGYIAVMPRNGQQTHVEDITDMISCGSMLASCSLDGVLAFWNVQSGERSGKLKFDSSLLTLSYLSNLSLLLAASGDCFLHFVNTIPPYTVFSSTHAKMSPKEHISTMKVDKSNRYLFLGGSEGQVQCYTVSNPNANNRRRKGARLGGGTHVGCMNNSLSYFASDILDLQAQWKAHDDDITALDYVENSVVLDTFLITASHSAVIKLWTFDGVWVGQFGQLVPWSLDNPKTYRATEPKLVEFSHDDEACARILANKRHPKPTGLIHSASLRMDGKVDVSRRWRMPEVGDVWVRDHLQLRASETTHKHGQDGSAPRHFEHAEMITIIRVGREDIVGWDGNSVEPGRKRHCVLDDFDAHSNIPWRRESRLSNLIGQVFECENDGDIFKAVYCFQRNREGAEDECEIVLRDHHFNVRKIPKNRTGHRSYSLFMLDKEREHERKLFRKLAENQDTGITEADLKTLVGEILYEEDDEDNEGTDKQDEVQRCESVPISKMIGPEVNTSNSLMVSKKKYGKKYQPSKISMKDIKTPKCYKIRQDKRRDFGIREIPNKLEDLVDKHGKKLNLSDAYFEKKKQNKKPQSGADRFFKSLQF